jgi:iron(III) transport system ATP-binding protein
MWRMAWLRIAGVGKQEAGQWILRDVSFEQQPSQKIAIAGATGSGKTTLLKIIAGLTQANSGHVHFEGKLVEGPDETLIPGHPQVAFLSQHFELRNKYRVEELLQMSNQLTERDAALVYAVCRIDHLLKRWTNQLSGGERQRIALASLLVAAPKLLLLDEPYSNLDALHKSRLKTVLQDISEQLQMTCLLVSHDPVDVLSWADTILVLQEGRLVQKGTPEFMYRYPVNAYVAGLFGSYNELPAELVRQLSATKTMGKAQPRFIRPEQLKIVSVGEGVTGNVVRTRFIGSYYEVEVAISEETITTKSIEPFEKGTAVSVSLL